MHRSGFLIALAAFAGLAVAPAWPAEAPAQLPLDSYVQRAPDGSWIDWYLGRAGATGDLMLHAQCNPYCPPENDNLAAAWWMGPGYVQSVDVRGATLEAGEPSPPCGAIDHSVWYRIEPYVAGAAAWQIDTAGSTFTPVMAVYTIEGLSPPGGAPALAAASCTGSLTFESDGTRTYYVQIGAPMGTAGGQLEVQTSCTGECDGGGVVVPVDTGGGEAPAGGVNPPDTGSGGYLPGARR